MNIEGREITRVVIVDDDPAARDGYAYPVEDLGLEPVKMPGPIGTTDSFLANLTRSDAVVCDYHLKKREYAPYDGDRLIAACYQAAVPGTLCTTFTDATARRDYLRYIPALLKTSSPEPESFVQAWRQCLTELRGEFDPSRRPWRTLVRVEEIDSGYLYAVVPAWDVRKKIRIDTDGLPDEIRQQARPGTRFHAEVNIGADTHEDLFFVSWEVR